MAPLPSVDSELQARLGGDPYAISAYNVCLKHELELATHTDQVCRIRVLGFLLLYAPKPDVRVYIAKSIFSCQDEPEVLVELGKFFTFYVILPFKKFKGRTPATTGSHPSRPSFEQYWREMKEKIVEAPKNHRDAKCYALIRDKWACAISGIVDFGIPADVLAQVVPPATSMVHTELAHIIPEATFFNVKEKSDKNPKLDYSACILAVLKMFHYDISSFNGEKVHSLANVITMQHDIHDLFDRLELYLEATVPTKNRYEVKYFSNLGPPSIRRFVSFSTNDPEHLPVPSSELLALHATCCKVAHMSGAAEYIDTIYDDAEYTGVLAFDGTSDILSFKLLSLANSPIGVQG